MDMAFYLPTHIIMENEAVANHSSLFRQFGSTALLVSEKRSDEGHAALDELLFWLGEFGIKTVSYDQIVGVPSIEKIEASAALAREAQVDFIIAMGATNYLDAGRAIALLAAEEIGAQTLAPTKGQKTLPLVCIPTEVGAGMEVASSILVREKDQDDFVYTVENPSFFPTICLLDARYLLDIPNDKSLLMCFETIGRAVEALLSEGANPLTDSLVVSSLGMIMDYPAKLSTEETLTLWDREDCMLASVQVGMAGSKGGNIIEALARPLSVLHGIELGQAYGLILLALLDRIEEEATFACEILLNATDFDTVEDFRHFFQPLLPSCAMIDSDKKDKLTAMALKHPQIDKTIVDLSPEIIKGVYQCISCDDIEVASPLEASEDQEDL